MRRLFAVAGAAGLAGLLLFSHAPNARSPHNETDLKSHGSLIPLLPVRSTSCRGGAAARWQCRARTGMLHVGCADG